MLILLVGTLLRFYKITEEAFWIDEIFQINATLKPLSEMFDYLPKDKPQLDYIIQHFFMKFGNDEFHARLHAAIFGILSIFAMYFLGKRLYGERVGLISAFLLSISPVHVFYSQEGRPYSLFFLLTILLHYFFYGAVIENKNVKRNWIAYWITSVLAVYTLYFFYTIFILQMLILFFYCFYLKQGDIKIHSKYILLEIITILIILIFNFQRMYNGANKYVEVMRELTCFSFISLSNLNDSLFCGYRLFPYYENAALLYCAPFMIGLIIGFSKKRVATSYLSFIYLNFLLINIAIYYIADAVMDSRYCLTNIIPIIVILSFFIDISSEYISRMFVKNSNIIILKSFMRLLITIILLSIITWNYFSFLGKPRSTKTTWRELIEYLKDNSEESEIIMLAEDSDFMPLSYYIRRYNCKNKFVSMDKSVDASIKYIQGVQKIWIVSKTHYLLDEYNEWLRNLPAVNNEEINNVKGYLIKKWENKPLIWQDDPAEYGKAIDFLDKERMIDIGSDEGDLLWGNWEISEKWGDITIRWAKNLYASVCVPLEEVQNLRLLINVCPFSDAKLLKKQKMKVVVNNVEVQTVELANLMGLYKVDVPEKFWKSGVNVLKFEFAYAMSPNSVSDNKDPRKLSAAFDYIKFEVY